MSLKNKFFSAVLIVMLAAAFTAVLPQAALCYQPALSDGEMIIMRPHKTGPADNLVYMKDDTDSQISKILRENPEFIKQVRLYQKYQKDKFIKGLKSNFNLSDSQINKILAGYKPDPVYMVVNEGLVKSVSFATNKPFGLLETGAGGKTSFSVKAAPLVTLSAATINELKSGDRWGYETVCHEIGHVMMYPTHGLLAYPQDITENIIEKIKKEGHWKNKVTTPVFAMLEGWAEFNGAFFTGRPIGDYTKIDGRLKTEDEMLRTEGLTAKIMLDICLNADINPDKDEGYEKITNTMMTHKSRTLNSFLKDYLKDYPQDRAVIEKIVKENTGGVVKIDYNYGLKDWWADKSQDLKKTFTVIKDWAAGLFGQKKQTAGKTSAPAVKAAVSTTPLKSSSSLFAAESSSTLYQSAPDADNGNKNAGDGDTNKKRKLLYDEYKKALETDDKILADEIFNKIIKLNGKLK